MARNVLDPDHVEQCLAALAALAADPALEPGRRDGTGAFIALEPAVGRGRRRATAPT